MMGCGKSRLVMWAYGGVLSLVVSGCLGRGAESTETSAQTQCAPGIRSLGRGSTQGSAYIFLGDPISASKNLNLSPLSTTLNDWVTPVVLKHLAGDGVLRGSQIEVRNGLQCLGEFGAYQRDHQFNYKYGDFRFQEAMTYYYADSYQSHLSDIGYLRSPDPVRVYAHCELEDNAYFTWARDSNSGQLYQMVCLGDSLETPGASYSDDSQVVIHELQHAATGDQYSSETDLNQFYYDEAGSMNEAISDFMALGYTDAFLNSSPDLDPRVFSRWALGTFFQGVDGSRGSHQCPSYDPHFPQCEGFPFFSRASRSSQVSLSFAYPDGLGWPYHGGSPGSDSLVTLFKTYPSQEEIHNAGTIVTGALWDAYALMKQNHGGNAQQSYSLMSQLVLESIRHLPQPDLSVNHSPVTFMELGRQLVLYAPYIRGLTHSDQDSLLQALTQRGLYQAPRIEDSQWLGVGAGTNFRLKTSKTPGFKLIDDPMVLKRWLAQQGADPQIIQPDPSQTLNSMLDPGEVVMVWFDLKNNSNLTAAGILLTVSSLDPEVEILDSRFNIGFLSGSSEPKAQVMYGKVNGSDILSVLNPPQLDTMIPMGNTYFSTNPYFSQSYRTGIWIHALATAPHGKWVRFRVQAEPANGVASTQEFDLQIH